MIIALTGSKGSGKDTVAEYLTSRYGFAKLSFARILKDVVSIMFGWDRRKIEGITDEDRQWREEVDVWWSTELGIPHFTPRFALENIGTDVFRKHFHQNIWILTLKREIQVAINGGWDVVITDLRFLNEEEFLTGTFKDNLVIIRTVRGDEISTGHISNTEFLSIVPNEYIYNNRTIKDLHITTDEILDRLL